MDKDYLTFLLEVVPEGLNRKIDKEQITKDGRKQLTERDKKTCRICGAKSEYGNPAFGIKGTLCIHHIIPNGSAELSNLTTLCKYCHCAVHMLLFAQGKWRYVPMK
jgi:5-methylcytosine-specific restriction endonuclease McrA